MKIKIYASGSKGNLYTVSDGKTKILIEMGLPIKKIKKLLNYDLKSVDFALLSHSHFDHSKAAKDIMKAGIDLYASKETAESLELSGHRLNILEPKKTYTVGTFIIMGLDTQHDCDGSMAFLIQSMKTREKLLFCTDSYYLKYKTVGVDYFMIEANYSKAILEENIEAGLIDPFLRDRITESHFEIGNVKEFFMNQDLSKCKSIHLIHLSDTNADPEQFEKEIRMVTGKPVFAFRS